MVAILVDAGSFLHRSYYSQPPMQRSDGLPTGCIHGFCEMLWKIKKREVDATHFAVMFDHGRSSIRTSIYPDYKANRKPIPDDLRAQMPLAVEAAKAFGIATVEAENTEADDLLASYATALDVLEHEVMIVSVDKDLMQLIGDRVSMFDPQKGQVVTVGDVISKLGVMPDMAIDAQALIGDPVDNVPGAPGIGPKKAAALLERWGSLERLIENAHLATPPSAAASLAANRDRILMSKKLVTLARNLPLPVPLRSIESKDVSAEALVAFARNMEFASFAADVAEFYRIGELA